LDQDSLLLSDRLVTELSHLNSNSELYDEETKFNLNSESSQENLDMDPLTSNTSLSSNILSNEKIRSAFKYIEAIRKSNMNAMTDPLLDSLYSITISQGRKIVHGEVMIN